MKKKKLLFLLGVLLITAWTGSVQAGSELDKYIDLSVLKNNGNDWQVLVDETDKKSGFVALHHDMWLMFFLHFRPLTKDLPQPSVEYATKKLLSFWGPNMRFDLTGKDGAMTIYGHKAFYVEGKLGNVVHTRFVVWNCPQSKRQFIADCNINLRRNTPNHFFELQQHISETIKCHGKTKALPRKQLTKIYRSKQLDLSFAIPEAWHTSNFEYQDFYPDGITPKKGSLWTLPTDSEKILVLAWQEGKVSADLLNSELTSFTKKTLTLDKSTTMTFEKVQVKKPTQQKGVWVADGRLMCTQKHTQPKPTSTQNPYRFRAFMWQVDDRAYFMLSGLIQQNEIWELKNDLSSSDAVFEQFQQSILQSIKVPNKPISKS